MKFENNKCLSQNINSQEDAIIFFPTTVVDPRSIDDNMRENYLSQIYDIFCECFNNENEFKTREEVYHLMMNPDPVKSEILCWQLFKNKNGLIVGFQNISIGIIDENKELGFGRVGIMRVKVAILKKYRSQSSIYDGCNFIMHQFSQSNPGTPLVIFTKNLHPKAYLLAVKVAGNSFIFPNNRNIEASRNIISFIKCIKLRYGLINNDFEGHVYVAPTNIASRIDSEESEKYSQDPAHEIFKFYTKMSANLSLISTSFHFLNANNWFGLPYVEEKKLNYKVLVHSKTGINLVTNSVKENYDNNLIKTSCSIRKYSSLSQSIIKDKNPSFFISMRKTFLTANSNPDSFSSRPKNAKLPLRLHLHQSIFFNQNATRSGLMTLNFIKKMK
jgi:hypothetical protein